MDIVGQVLQEFYYKYGRMLWLSVVVFVLTLLGYQYFLHRASVSRQEVFLAYKEVSRLVAKKVDAAAEKDAFASEEEKFDKVYELSKKYFDLHSKDGISLYFLMVCARVDHKTKGALAAIETLKSGLAKVKNSVANEIVRLNIAILKLNSQDSVLEVEGFAELEKLGDYGKLVSDYAYYKLGHFCWEHQRNNDAKGYWNTLIAGHKKPGFFRELGSSVWAKKAQEHLAMIN